MGSFDLQLIAIIRSPQFREACIQRLVAACIEPAEGFRVMNVVIDRVREGCHGSFPRLAGRLLRVLEAACADYAEMRCHPFKKVVGPLTRGWHIVMSFAKQAGLTEEEGYAAIRDMLRKIPSSQWDQVQDVDRKLFEEMRYGFSVLGLARGHRPLQVGPGISHDRLSAISRA